MKNLQLRTKLLVMTAAVSAVAILIAWVGASRLEILNAKVSMMGSETLPRVIASEGMRSKMLMAIREQKNSILSTNDVDSEKYATESKRLLSEVESEVNDLNSRVTDAVNRDLIRKVEVAIGELKTVNDNCLNLAIQNTNVKAKSEYYGRALDHYRNSLPQLQTLTKTLELNQDATKATSGTDIVDDLRQLYLVAGQHIDTPISDPRFAEIDSQLKGKIDQFSKAIDRLEQDCRASNLSFSECSVSLNGFRTSIAEILRLSQLDTNNRSTELSLNASREKTSAALVAMQKLVSSFQDRANQELKESDVIYTNAWRYLYAACGLGLGIGFLASYTISRSITSPIERVRAITNSMSNGDLTSRIHLVQSDEVGQLASATDMLADSLSDMVAKIQSTSTTLGLSSSTLGQISHALAEQSEDTSMRANSVAAAAEEMSTNINTMSAAAEQMSMNFASISSATEELSTSVGAISSAAEQTSTNVANVSHAVQAISSSFDTVLADVRQGAKVAGQARQMAENAGKAMNDLDKSSSEISKFTETIKMIALQTNLLALNATIEATSAGEAGKGFAVVAHEIKELANQSAKAAEDIAKKIEDVQGGARQAVGVIREIGEVIKSINQSADRISESVEGQSRSAQTISLNVTEANQGVGHIARSISEVASTANLMARNIAEASRGALDVSRNVGEAARASSGISGSIVQVSSAAKQTNLSASGVTAAAKELDNVAADLRSLVSKFKIVAHGNG